VITNLRRPTAPRAAIPLTDHIGDTQWPQWGPGSMITGHSHTKATGVDCRSFPQVNRPVRSTVNSLEQARTVRLGYRRGTAVNPHEHPPTGTWLCQGCTAAEHEAVRG